MANIAVYCPIIILSVLGAEFVAPFSSRSCSLALKSSLKSHQMTIFLVQKRGLSEKNHHLSENFIIVNKQSCLMMTF